MVINSVALLLLLLAVTTDASPSIAVVGCVEDNAAAPLFTFLGAGTDIEGDVTSDNCGITCLKNAFAYAGISEGTYCLCGEDDVNIPLLSPGTCDVVCADSSDCGSSLNSNHLSAYTTGGGPPNFTVSAVHTVGSDVTLTAVPLALGETFLVDFNYGAPGSYFNSTSIVSEPLLVPGDYTFTVRGMIEGTTLVYTQQTSVSVPATPSVDFIGCPIVWEPDEVYYCNVSVTPADPTNEFSATFDDVPEVFLITGFGAEFYRLGNPPPRGLSSAVADPSSITDEIFLQNFPVMWESEIVAFDLYGMDPGTFTVSMKRPTCASGIYCFYAKLCMEECPYDTEAFLHKCDAADFCSLTQSCEATCPVPEGDPTVTWTDVPGTAVASAFTGEGFKRELLPAPVLVLPGDSISVTGPVGRIPVDMDNGDLVGGVATTHHHFVSAVIKQPHPVQLAHICTRVNVDVNLDVVDSNGIAIALQNHTSCERNITDVAMKVSQPETDAFNATLNEHGPYFIRSNVPATYTVMFSVAGPVTFTFTYEPDFLDPAIPANHSFTNPGDFPLDVNDVDHELTHVVTHILDETYIVTVSAENQHNIIPGPITNFVLLHVQHEVTLTWECVADDLLSYQAFKIPSESAKFRFFDPSGANFPTNASVYVDWGDGTAGETLPFDNPGTNEPIKSHNYTKHGEYTITAYIYNVVSGYEISCDVTIIEEIKDFIVSNKYYPTLWSVDPRDGFGRILNQYPMDKNLTFFPAMTQGTVNSYRVEFTNNNSEIFIFTPLDRFKPTDDAFHFHFNAEVFLNLTVYGINIFEEVPVYLFVEIVGEVRVGRIDDWSIVTEKEELKWFEVTFESLGGGTCLILDFGDKNPPEPHAYGEEITCKTNFSHAIYHADVILDVANNFSYVYDKDGIYNASIFAYNPVSSVAHTVMILVTSIKCRPPILEIIDAVLDHFAAPRIKKADDFMLVSSAKVDCEVTSKTKKRWQIYAADAMTGGITEALITQDMYETWNKPEFVLPGGTLLYGYYKLTYTLTMWDPDFPELEAWPFQKQVETYIEIVKTPIIAVTMESAVSRVTRGPPQEVVFNPKLWSIDPDFPTILNFSISWRCRAEGEAWPAGDDPPNPIWQKGTGGGCFGHGPGALDYYEGDLTLLGSEFIQTNVLYEVEVTAVKDTRTHTSSGEVFVIDGLPPMVKVICLEDALCTNTPEGIYINPSFRMALVAECIDYCENPLSYKWKIADQNDVPIAITAVHFPVGDDSMEFALSPQFFVDYPNVREIHLSIEVKPPSGPTGGAAYFFLINEIPVGGSCDLILPPLARGLVDYFHLECSGWSDPEKIGITAFNVYLIEGTVTTPLVEIKYSSVTPLVTPLVLPPGTCDVIVHVVDKWGGFKEVEAYLNLEVAMPTFEEVEAAEIGALIESLAGEGNVPMLTMIVAAQSRVTKMAPWLSLDEDDIAGLSQEELDARISLVADQNNAALNALFDNANLNTLGGISTTTSTIANIVNSACANTEAIKSIDMKARDTITEATEAILDGIMKVKIPSPDLLEPLLEHMATIAGGMALGQTEAGSRETCQKAPPTDLRDSDSLPFDTRIRGLDDFIPEDPVDVRKCNVRDVTKDRAKRIVPKIENALDEIAKSMLKRMVTGESYEVSTPNGLHMKMGIMKGEDLGVIPLGTNGGYFSFPDTFNPQGNRSLPIAYTARETPFITHSYADSAANLSKGSHVMDIDLYNRMIVKLDVTNQSNEIEIGVPSVTESLPEFEEIDAVEDSAKQRIPILYSTFNITKTNAAATLEFIPEEQNDNLFLLISKPRLPTLTKHEWYKRVKDLTIDNGTYVHFFKTKELSGTGEYYLGVGQFLDSFNQYLMSDPVVNDVKVATTITNITTNYKLRVYTSGCYYFDKDSTSKEWSAEGLSVAESSHDLTKCSSTHLSSFATGMFIMPNTIDFNYVFANMGFADNLTIYLTLIISLSIFIILMIWARFKDKKDKEKLGAAPLPDNKVEDKYLYEILVFTGNKKEAQSDSIVHFIVSGDNDETDVRTLGDDRRKILRKSGIDVFVMSVPRPLGPLQYLRVWHDNSGKGPNASWYLCYIVFRDVQTGEKYEFIANRWLGVEWDDGQIDRLLTVAGKEERGEFKHLFNTTTNKNIADGHLWFSVFLRPVRSRFTRCQRVASCFALLFLSMLVNAMWYDVVPESPGAGGLNIGPFHLSPEQIGVGVMSNLIVFPPSFLIVFIFRKARPRVLRQSRIEKAVERSKTENKSAEEPIDQEADPLDPTKEVEEERTEAAAKEYKRIIDLKKKKKKKFTLPWWFVTIAWLLVVVCMVVSCFFLLMYGIMFGNSKCTKWITSLIISFFSSILFVQPLKIFLMAMLVSAIFKSSDLDEDDAEEDEEDPCLEHDEAWLYSEGKRQKTLQHNKIDDDTLEGLRKSRKKEVEMWAILMEIMSYAFFIWVVLILSYGNRDPNAFYMQKTLRDAFLHEGALDGTDYTKVTNADRFWFYLFNGLMTDLRADFLYNGVPPYGLRGFLGDQCNRIMGYATVRQIRVQEHTCRVPSMMRKLTYNCSGFSSLLDEDSRHYCAGWNRPTEETKNTPNCKIPEFRYETASQLHSLPIWGTRDWYGGGGYVIHLQASTPDILKKFKHLQKNHWIDEQTRAVLIEFSSYNSQVNLFGLSLIMAEFTPGGGITPSYKFEGIRLLNHHDNFGLFIILCEVVFVLFVMYFTYKEIRLMIKLKRKYFEMYWSYAEIAILVACYTAITVYFLRNVATYKVLNVFNETYGNGYVKMQYAASLDETFGYLVAFITFVGELKFIKLLRFNKRIGILSATLRQCWDDLSGFLIAFFLCFFTFVAMFYLLLNKYLEGFYNFITAVETCFSMMLGKFQFEEMKQVSLIVPFMFFVFVLCNSWVLINLLLTLVIKSFQQVKHDLLKQPNEYEMVAFVWGRFMAFVGLGGRPQQGAISTTKAAENDPHADDKVNELPSKVDKFLDYVNNVYFGGSLDTTNKDVLKSSMYRGSAMPRSGRQSGGLWHGERPDQKSTGLRNRSGAASGKGPQAGNTPLRPNRNITYEGPRITNKFQADLDNF